MKRKDFVRLFAIIMTGVTVIGMSGCERKPKRVKYGWIERKGIGTEVTMKELEPQSIGRHFYTEDTNYRFGFSGTGVCFGFTGDKLEIDFNCCKSYLAVYIDDEEEKVVVASEEGYMTLAEGLTSRSTRKRERALRSSATQSAADTAIFTTEQKCPLQKWKTDQKLLRQCLQTITMQTLPTSAFRE